MGQGHAGRAPPPGQAQPSSPTKAPQTWGDLGQRAFPSSGPSSAERWEQQPPRPQHWLKGEQGARARAWRAPSSSPWMSRCQHGRGPALKTLFRVKPIFKQTSFGASVSLQLPDQRKRLAFYPPVSCKPSKATAEVRPSSAERSLKTLPSLRPLHRPSRSSPGPEAPLRCLCYTSLSVL